MFGDKSTQDISTKVPWFWRGFFPQSQIINQSLLSIIEDDKQCWYWGIQRNSIRVFNNWTIHDIVHPIPKFGPIGKIGVGEIMSLWIAQMLQFCMIFFLWILIKLTLHSAFNLQGHFSIIELHDSCSYHSLNRSEEVKSAPFPTSACYEYFVQENCSLRRPSFLASPPTRRQ